MSFIRKLEEAAAKKLRKVFLAADKRAEYAANDIVRLEKELTSAKAKAVEEAKAALESATRAAEKAQKVAQELMLEVKACEERLRYHEEILEKSNK